MRKALSLLILLSAAVRSSGCPMYPLLNNITLHGAYVPGQKTMLLGLEWDKAGPGRLFFYRSLAVNYHLNDPYQLKSIQLGVGNVMRFTSPVILCPAIGVSHYYGAERNRTHFTYGLNLHLHLQDNRKWVNGRIKFSYQRFTGAGTDIKSRHLFTAGLGITLNSLKFTHYKNVVDPYTIGGCPNF